MKKSTLLFSTETQRYAFWGFLFGLLFPILATILRILGSNLPLNFSSAATIQARDSLLWIIDTAPLFLSLFASLAGRRQDRLLDLNTELRKRETELELAQVDLENRVAERTRELSAANQQVTKRASQLELVAKVAQFTVSLRDVDRLLPQIAHLISRTFDFYHVGIFLLDEEKRFAVLRASNSLGGDRMLKRGHRLKVGEQGIVGFVTQSGKPRIALDVGADAVHFNNPDLPETHSEMALPLRSGEELIGALDIQSTVPNAFTDEDVATLSILADQVAIAIQNAELFEQAQNALQKAELASKQALEQTWKGFTKQLRFKGYRYDGIKPEALKETDASHNDQSSLLVPVQLRGQTLGRFKLIPSDSKRKWTEDELSIIESTAERLAIALESSRLLEDAQKRAAREALLSDVSAKLSTSFRLDSILRDTVEELGQTFKGSSVTFQLVNPSAPPTADSVDAGTDTPTYRQNSD